jgi:hypothetical protein
MGDDIEQRLTEATARLRQFQSATSLATDLLQRQERIDAEIAAIEAERRELLTAQ